MLEYLADVAVEDLEPEEDEDGDEMGGFKLTFTFAPNPYFDHETLVRARLLPQGFAGSAGEMMRSAVAPLAHV